MINDRDLLLATAKREKQERLLYYAEFVGQCWTNILEYYNFTDMNELYEYLGFFNPQDIRPLRKSNAPSFDYSEYFNDI